MTRPVQPGEKILPNLTASWFNDTLKKVDKSEKSRDVTDKKRLVLCRTTTTIAAAVIDVDDTEDSVYYAGVVNLYSLTETATNTFSPGLLKTQKRMINPAEEEIPSGTEVWAEEAVGGLLIASIWSC